MIAGGGKGTGNTVPLLVFTGGEMDPLLRPTDGLELTAGERKRLKAVARNALGGVHVLAFSEAALRADPLVVDLGERRLEIPVAELGEQSVLTGDQRSVLWDKGDDYAILNIRANKGTTLIFGHVLLNGELYAIGTLGPGRFVVFIQRK